MCVYIDTLRVYAHTGLPKEPRPVPVHHRRMQLPPPAFCCSQRRERAGEPGRPLLEGFSHQSNPTNHDQLGKAFARAARLARPVFGKRLEVPARTLQGSWLRRLLSDRGSEATGGVGAVIMGKKRGQSLRGGVVPRPGSVGAGSPGRITNLRFPSACAVSAWYGKPRR